nr:hypothetical protein [Candidatus Sigynarchaeum springense]MDO8116116.1 hypothetical protein [Candidatus Sigynarchaeota archaeon]
MNSFQLAFVGKIKDEISLILHVPMKRSRALDPQGDSIHPNVDPCDTLKIKCSAVNRRICEPFLQELLVDDNIITRKSFQTSLIGNCNQIVIDRREDGDILVVREEIGVKIALLFALISKEIDIARIERLAREIRAMQKEELYYWYAKIFSAKINPPALKALKILLLN